jgi:AraC-like DNA-binding protein
MKVIEELKTLGIPYYSVDLGVIELQQALTATQQNDLKANLLKSGLVLMDDQRSILIEKIKTIIIEMIHHTDEMPKVNYSNFISEKLKYDYTYLSNIFSETKGITIQQFIIIHKIERVKELMLYDELTLSEIASKLHYSSAAHLSLQFKKITGLTPSFYKKLKHLRTSNLEDL